jgi:hypothetical protein
VQDRGVTLGRVPAFIADDPFKLAQSDPVFIGEFVVGLGI